MRNVFLTIMLTIAILCLAAIPGCLWKNGDSISEPSSFDAAGVTNPPPAPQNSASARFQIVLPMLPASSNRGGLSSSAIRADIASAAPTVTFKLILVNAGNTASLTSTLSRVVPVASDGSASATFTGVSQLTAIGDIHIDNGHIGSFSDFQGAVDLVGNKENVIFASPKGSFTRLDLDAEIIRRLVESPSYLAQVVPQLATRVDAAMQTCVPQGVHSYDDAFTAFLNFVQSLPRMVTASSTNFVNQTIGAGDTTITVASPGSTLDGLEIQIPAGAFQAGANVRVDAAAISSHTLPIPYTLISPLIQIDTGGKIANTPILIKIPVTVPEGKMPIAFLFNPATGKLETLPIASKDINSVTIFGTNFQGLPTIAGSRRADVFSSLKEGIVITAISSLDVPDTQLGNFDHRTHTWSIPNYATTVATHGYCAGWSLTTLWSWKLGPNRPISDEHYEWGTDNSSDPFNTPTIWQDNCQAIRFVSVVQRTGNLDKNLELGGKIWSSVDDRLTSLLFRVGLKNSGEPQIVQAWSSDLQSSHMMLVYHSEGNDLYVVDPNYPKSSDTKISVSNGKFSPYQSLNETYSIFAFVGSSKAITEPDLSKGEASIGDYWMSFVDKRVGKDKGDRSELLFPDITLQEGSPGQSEPKDLTSGAVVTSGRLSVVPKFDTSKFSDCGLRFFRKDGAGAGIAPEKTQSSGISVFNIPLNPGSNSIGIEIDLVRAAPKWEGNILRNGLWADFQWFDVWYLASPTNLKAIPGDRSVKLTWDPVDGAASYTIYWSNFPGVTKTNGTAITDVKLASYTISGLMNGKYYFIVTANAGGVESAPSTESSAEPTAARFVRGSDLIITDFRTGANQGYQWYCSWNLDGADWYHSDAWAKGLTVGGGGWTLPTRDQLKALGSDAVESGLFSDSVTWSSEAKDPNTETSGGDNSTAWTVILLDGSETGASRLYASLVPFAVRSRR